MSIHKLYIAMCLSALLASCEGREKPSPQTTKKKPQNKASIHISFTSDDTGFELKKAGVKAIITPDDILEATKQAVKARRNVTLHFSCVDEKAHQDKFASQTFLAFHVTPPKAPDWRNMTGSMREKAKLHKAYQAERAVYLNKWGLAAKKIKLSVDTFHTSCLILQTETQRRFDKELARVGHDYPRSDIASLLPLSVKKLGSEGIRILILNTDCVDTVRWRTPRRKPFTKKELPEDIIIITTATNLTNNPLFQGLGNKIIVVDSVKKAIAEAFAKTTASK